MKTLPPLLARQTNQINPFAMPDLNFLPDDSIVLGYGEDPLLPFHQRFSQALMLLEGIHEVDFKHFHLRTRSPLVLVLAPMLRALGTRCTVTMAIETLSDHDNAQYTAFLPKTSERLDAVKTLSTLGIDVAIQFAPVITTEHRQEQVAQFVATLLEHTKTISIHDAEEVLGTTWIKKLNPTMLMNTRNRLVQIFVNRTKTDSTSEEPEFTQIAA